MQSRLTQPLAPPSHSHRWLLTLLVLAVAGVLFAAGGNTAFAQSSSGTTNISLDLKPTYQSIGVYVNFDGDTNQNAKASLQYRVAGGPWKPGPSLIVDRRSTVTQHGSSMSNPWRDQWRTSLVGLHAGVTYEVRVSIDDPDGESTSSISRSTTTWPETDTLRSTGKSYYVSTSGSDSSGSGSSSSPWRTIQRAADRVAPGDIVYVRSGTYNESVVITTSGTSSNYIVFTAYPGEKPEVRPAGSTSNRESSGFATDASYVRINGFRIVGGNTGVRLAESSTHVIVEGNHIEGYAGDGYGVRIGGDLDGPGYSDDTTVESITVKDNTIVVTQRQNQEHGGIESSATNLGNHVIRGNEIRFTYNGNGSHGEDCIVHNENSSIDASYNDTDIYNNRCINSSDDGIELDGANVNMRVWGNVVDQANIGVSIAASGVGPVYVFRNVFSNPKDHWTSCVGIKTGERSTGFSFFYHNTFYLPDQCGGVRATGFVNSGNDRLTDNVTLKNNIFYVNGRAFRLQEDETGDFDFVADHNLYADVDGGTLARAYGTELNSIAEIYAETGQDQHSLEAMPSFVNAGAGDFRLANGSKGIDLGQMIPGFNNAESGWPYRGAAPDVGAFENGSGGSPAPTPTPTPGNTPSPTPSPSPTPTPTQTPGGTPTPTPSPTPNPGGDSGSGETIYDDSLHWDNWSWNTEVVTTSTDRVAEGSRSMSVTFQGAWAGLLLNHGGFDTTGLDSLRLLIHPDGNPFPNLNIAFYDAGGRLLETARAASYASPMAGGWYVVDIPLDELSADGTVVTRVQIQDRSGRAQPTFYIDDFAVTDAEGSPTSPPSQSAVVYDDALHWDDWSWGTSLDPAATAPTYQGSRAMSVTYSKGWAGVLLHDEALDTSPYDSLRFAVHADGKPFPNIDVSLYDAGGNLIARRLASSYATASGAWYVVDIPLADLNADNTTISRIQIQNRTSSSQPTFYLDSIAFISN